ncbi:MAG: hypothetical protein IPP58_03865 [Holophagaceae bacterium]|uniref:Uncharacterized protein n=1 Tax=Candidatus Geothrix skivensis TaxID=2954439 RepID=A0A9D7SDJ4_9BACT|nr:hypothetical protein [Candidatus Geothrix skivensis]
MLIIPALVLSATAPAQASEFTALKEEIATARKALVNMALYRDKRSPEQQKLVKDTADRVSAHLARMKAPAGKPAEFKELKATWEAFKKTREEELVPAILAGEQAKSDKIGAGIQKTRLDRIYALIDAIEK